MEQLVSQAVQEKDPGTLEAIATLWIVPTINPNRTHLAQALDAAQKAVDLENGQLASSLVTLGEVYYNMDEKRKAIECCEKAMQVSEDDEEKASLERHLQSYKK